MKFSDLFVQKHMNSNPEIRKKAIAKLTDQKLLAQMAEGDEDAGVRSQAVERLSELRSSQPAKAAG